MRGHVKTQTFSLIGRRIILHEPYRGCTEGMIIGSFGPTCFSCYLQRLDGTLYRSGDGLTIVNFHRGEFVLPPRPHAKRRGVYLPDDSDGFAYADEPNF